METKLCSKCKQELALTDFYDRKDCHGNTLKRSWCKKCEKSVNSPQVRRDYYRKNKEKIKQRSKSWYDNNKIKAKESRKKWQELNKNKIKKQKAEYRQIHKEEIKKWKREYFQRNKKKIIEGRKDYAKNYYQNNKRKIKERTERWYNNTKDKRIKQQKEYNKNKDPQKRREYNRKYYANNTKRMLELYKKSRIKKMISIYGPNWESRNFRGECLTADILADLFPNVKIQRGSEGRINTLGTCIRKHIYPDFRFIYLDKEIIIEYNGEQHYRHIPSMMSLRKFTEIQERDKWLRDYCVKNNKILIEIDERKVHTNKNKIESELRIELTKHGIL